MSYRRVNPPIGLTTRPERGRALFLCEFLVFVVDTNGEEPVSATLVTAAAAGWYHDPNDSGSWRWWDGGTWTSHVRPKEQPSTAPQPVSAPQQVIPQPAQPIQPIQPVSLTPETPASEQEYWHSAAAEVVVIPGRSATSHSHASSAGAATSYKMQHQWGDVGSPNTAGIWLLAFLPIIASVLSSVVAIVLQGLVTPRSLILDPTGASQTLYAVLIGYVLVLTLSAWLFAGNDIRTLRVRGYDAPSIWWMLVPLSPLAYFIARGKVVRAEGKRAWPPELLFFLSIMLPIVLTIVGMIFAASLLAGLAGVAGIPA
jgi:hypothetical protein